MRIRFVLTAILLAAAALLAGCMGMTTRSTPLEVWPDMDRQPKIEPQQEYVFFSDKRGSRMPPPGTVARGHLNDNEVFYTGVVNNQYVGRNPLEITPELMALGQTRFNTYCSPCHDRTGSGQGLVPKKSLWLPTNLHEDRVLKMNDGEIFNVISHGRRSMPPYRFQVAEHDRWAIVAYVRALQRAGLGTIEEAPENLRGQLTAAVAKGKEEAAREAAARAAAEAAARAQQAQAAGQQAAPQQQPAQQQPAGQAR